MSALDDELKILRERLDALAQIKTQEDFDEGARLHNEKNAPWVSGMYSHLRFEPYEYKEYPKAMYGPDFMEARKEVHNARYLSGVTDQERQEAVKEAERVMNLHVALVTDVTAERQRASFGWNAVPEQAAAHHVKVADELALQAAHLAYEDRHLGEAATRERDAADDASEGHLVDVPRKPGRPRKEPAHV